MKRYLSFASNSFFWGFAMVTRGLKSLKIGFSSVVLGSICAIVAATPSKADYIADRIIQNVIQNILQNVRDQIQSRRLARPYYPGRLQFTGEDANVISNADDPFSALAYAKAPYTKAPPVPPAPIWIYGLNLVGSGDWSRSGGFTTNASGVTGAVDVTKIGIFEQYDALTVILTGSGIWSSGFNFTASTGVGAGTIAYVNGGFSGDFTIDGTWTSSRMVALGLPTRTDSTGVSYSPNVHYKVELGDTWYVEPSVGAVYTQLFDANFGNQTGDSTEVHGGARVGMETTWVGVRVEPSLTVEAFSIVEQTGTAAAANVTLGNGLFATPAGATGAGTGVPTGAVGGRASGKLNFIWTPSISSYFEAHGSGISSTTAYGLSTGLRWTF